VQAHCHAAAEAQRALQRRLAIGDRRSGFADVGENAPAQLQEGFTGVSEPDLAPEPKEQRLAQLLLEQQDLPADCRLRDVQAVCGRRERAGVGDGTDDFELPEITGGA
jgi:hypothetical protein